MPGVALKAAATCAPCCSLLITTTGCPAPAGKCRSTTRWPTTESGVLRNPSAVVRPLDFSPRSPSAIAPRITTVVTQTTRGRRAIRSPVRAQNPRAVGSSDPNVGRAGQNTHRPQATSSAGSSVIIAAKATTMPMASTGPRLAVELSSAIVSVSRLTMTVPALAMMAGPARRSANAIASCRSS